MSARTDNGSPQAHPARDSDEFAVEVRGMFDRIAGVYDLINSVMTAGLHHQWREKAVDRAAPAPGDSALDVACGTGDLTLELQRRVGTEGRVVGSDFSEAMLDLAREKGAAFKLEQPGTGAPIFEWGDALELPYDDASFDVATVGFGVRNFADLDRGIRELTRVLKPGGRLVILEITQPTRPPLSTFFSLWFDRAVPLLGLLAGDADAYSYLPESVRSFPAPEKLAAKFDTAGLEQIRWTILAGGIIAIHVGTKPGSPGATARR